MWSLGQLAVLLDNIQFVFSELGEVIKNFREVSVDVWKKS